MDCGIFHPSSDNLAFTSGASERMRVTNNGNLLIGGTTDGLGRLVVTAASSSIAFQHTSNYSWDGGTHEQANVNRALTHAYMLFNTSVSTTSPTFWIDGSGDASGHAFITTSDKSLKENFDTLTGALAKVKQMQGFYYNFKSSVTGIPNPRKEMGLIAQDVEIIAPEAVSTNFGLKGIAYQQIVALLVEAIKEQDKEITQLQTDLNNCCIKSGNRTSSNGGVDNNGNKLDLGTGNTNVIARLSQNNPNPFSQSTVIKCFIPEGVKSANLMVFDMSGILKRTIAVNGRGETSVTINGKELIAGMYHYSLITDGQEIDTKKMILTE